MSDFHGICSQCGTVGRAIKKRPGSTFVQFFLILFFFFPGLLYWIWRSAATNDACPSCESPNTMIPSGSPRGKQMIEEGRNKALEAAEKNGRLLLERMRGKKKSA